MDGVVCHIHLAGDECQIVEAAVVVVAVTEYDDVASRDGAIHGFPHQAVLQAPGRDVPAFVGDFDLDVAIDADALGADGRDGVTLVALEEPPLFAAGCALAEAALVEGDLAFFELMQAATVVGVL